MPVIGGVLVYQLRDGFDEGMAWGDGANASTSYLVPNWFDRYTVANALLSTTSYVSTGGGRLTITTPGAYADSVNLLAKQISIRGVGQQFQGPRQIAFTSAIITTTYGVPKWDAPGQDPAGQQSLDPSAPLVFASQHIKFGGQWLTIPRSKLKTLGGANLDQEFGRFVGVNTLSCTLHQFPFLVNVDMRSLIGKMNNASFFGCAAGTLMLHGIDTQRTADTAGTVNQETTYEFSERPEAAWNFTFTGGGSSGWEKVVTTSRGDVIFSGDFRSLIPGFYRGA